MEMMSAQLDQLFIALCNAQKEMKVAPKDSNNPFFKSKYADLQTVWETIKGPLCNHGLCVSQILNEAGENSCLITILGHSSGQWIKSITPLKLKITTIGKDGTVFDKNLNAQEVCASVTYFRRMALSAITGCYAGEADDDGETAVSRESEKKAPPKLEKPNVPTLSSEQIKIIREAIKFYPDMREEVLKFTGKNLISDIEMEKFQSVMDLISLKLKDKEVA